MPNTYTNSRDLQRGLYDDVVFLDKWIHKTYKVDGIHFHLDFYTVNSLKGPKTQGKNYTVADIVRDDDVINPNYTDSTHTKAQLEEIARIKKLDSKNLDIAHIRFNKNHSQVEMHDKVANIVANLIVGRQRILGIKETLKHDNGAWTSEGNAIFRRFGFEADLSENSRKTFKVCKSQQGQNFLKVVERMKTNLVALTISKKVSKSTDENTKVIYKCKLHDKNKFCEQIVFLLSEHDDATIKKHMKRFASIETICKKGTFATMEREIK